MGVLARNAIFAEMAARRLTVDPYLADQVGPASIDVTLGDEVRLADQREL
jgi:deoxycytidine triphosphate deaminase